MTTVSDMLFDLGGVPVRAPITQGKHIFVDPRRGLDGNSGLALNAPRKTLTAALALVPANDSPSKGDTVYLLAQSNTAANTTDYQTETLTWSKDLTHLIGVNGAPCRVSPRSRIATASTAAGTDVAPLVTLSANNCLWENIAVFAGVPASAPTGALGGMLVSGSRNVIRGCHIAGMGDTTMDAAGQFSLKVTGSENLFEDCTIGLDTIARTTATYEMYMSGGATRNIFRRCRIVTYAAADTMTFLTVPVNGLDRWNLFEDCMFINMPTGVAAGTTIAQAFDVTGGGSPDGCIIVKNSLILGATASETAAVSGKVYYFATATGKMVATAVA